jgi:uncharacterized membrane protein YqiK
MTTEVLLHYAWVIPVALVVVFHKLALRLCLGMVIINQDQVGIVNKKWVLLGKNRTLPDGAIVAMNGEAGIQADTLAPGSHFGLWPWQYAVSRVPFVTIERNKIGLVQSLDGRPLKNGRVLAKTVDSNSYQNARQFLTNGGERGPQIGIIPPGTYRINTQLFQVTAADVLDVADNSVGIVTTREGAALPAGEIAGKKVAGHNGFQDGEAFLAAGGQKGLQEQVILAGRYFINPRFASVEVKPMTEVPIASVGVVIAYVGEEGVDQSGDGFQHGNLVMKGQKGVWVNPLDPGRYPINTYTHKVEVVPTANIVLNWASGKSEAHHLDERLSTITVRSSDGFTFNLDVSQIIHVPSNDAPKVIARFGTMANLVTQVLEPTIGNYFRNAAQDSDVIEFLKGRTERQKQAKEAIQAELVKCNVNAVDTLIGDIVPPADLMKTLTDRKIAEQEQVTYKTQELAENTRKELQQAKAMADTQATVVASERQVSIAEFQAQAAVKKAEGEARASVQNADGAAQSNVLKADGEAKASIRKAEGERQAQINLAEGQRQARINLAEGEARANVVMAEADAEAAVKSATGQAEAKKLNGEADANVVITVGKAEADKTLAVGEAEAAVIKKKIESMEAGNYAAIQVARELATNHTKMVPDIMVGSGADSNNGLMNVLLARLVQSPNGVAKP